MTITSPNPVESETLTKTIDTNPAESSVPTQTQPVTEPKPVKTAAKPIAKIDAKPAASAAAKPVVNAGAAEKTVAAAKTTNAKTGQGPLNKRTVKPKATPMQKVASETAAKAEKAVKAKKPKLVRDSFTMPKDEISVIEDLKLRALALSHAVKKSELIRAGIKALAAMSDSALMAAMKAVPAIKTGRPSK